METRPTRRPRHLMDPAHPQRPVNDRALTQVQRWVLSVLAVTTILHLAAGLLVEAYVIDVRASRIALCVLAGVVGVVAMGVGRLIHQASLLTPWLLLGALPGLVGLVWVIFG